MRSRFDEQLDLLNEEMINMGAFCESAIATCAKALDSGDIASAEKVQDISVQINHKEREIEALCMKLILQQQPVARDLRTISSALKMISDMKRIGDQSADIAEIITMSNISAGDDTFHTHEMANAVIKMVNGSVDAFVKKNVKAAKEVIAADANINSRFDEIKHNIIEKLCVPGTDSECAVDLLMIAKYFERIGDHAKKLAGWVVYSTTGIREED